MRGSKQLDYAIRVMLALAENEGRRLGVDYLAQTRGIPCAFLFKVVQTLARSGLVVTTRGPRGGVRLARPAHEIDLCQVVEAIEGEDVFQRCVLGQDDCSEPVGCPVDGVWRRAQAAMVRELQAVSLRDLVRSAPGARGLQEAVFPPDPVVAGPERTRLAAGVTEPEGVSHHE